jgi:hypothetical protein
MSRTHTNNYTIDSDPKTVSGYDYRHNAWVLHGFYCSCAHPDDMDCGCFGRDHASDPVPPEDFPNVR